MKFSIKKIFVFDWDGTLLDSMSVKSLNFGAAYKATFSNLHIPDLETKATNEFLRLSGAPRKQIFLDICSILQIELRKDSYMLFNQKLEYLNKLKLKNACIFQDALELLRFLISQNHHVYISSSVPSQELNDIIYTTLPIDIKSHISLILGSSEGHTKGRGHINSIAIHSGYSLERFLVIGDDYVDHELSSLAGVDCIVVNRRRLLPRKGIHMVHDLNIVKNLIH